MRPWLKRRFLNCSTRAVYGATLTCWLLAACQGDERAFEPDSNPITAAVSGAAATISGELLERHIRELSSDAYGGRSPGTAGDRKTQAYIVEQMQSLGLQPGAPGRRWRQAFELVGLNAEQPATWRFQSRADGRGEVQFEQSTDFIVGSGVQSRRAAVEDAEVVFVGFGIQAPEYHWDDYKGVDVSGKLLLMLNNDPHWSEDLFQGEARLYYGRWSYKYEMAAALGAAGAIIVHTDYSAGYPWQVVQTSWSGTQFELPNQGEAVTQVKAWMTEDAVRRLVALSGGEWQQLVEQARSRDFQPVELALRTSLSMPVTLTRTETANVLGVLPGSDVAKSDEVVVYSAHHDHLGTDEDATLEDRIYNGAMDNAAGVASVLAIAAAFKSMRAPPRRSILFAFVGAEEQGLLGSLYYARHPTYPPRAIAANVNMDGGQVHGRTADVAYIGYGRSDLDRVAEAVAARQHRVIVGDQMPHAGYFYRSDHFSFARIGVPSINFRGGSDLLDGGKERGRALREAYITEHYHQPGDEVSDDWRFDGLAEDAQFGFYCGHLIADQDALPAWYPGDEFEAARLRALESQLN